MSAISDVGNRPVRGIGFTARKFRSLRDRPDSARALIIAMLPGRNLAG
jgi:hypothetical protein